MARASRRKREVRSLRLASFGCRILIATMRFMAGCDALYTEPIPPVPIFSKIKYSPPRISRPIKGSLGRIRPDRYQKLLPATSAASADLLERVIHLPKFAFSDETCVTGPAGRMSGQP